MHPDWLDYISRTEAGWAKMLDTLAAVLGEDRGSGHENEFTPQLARTAGNFCNNMPAVRRLPGR